MTATDPSLPADEQLRKRLVELTRNLILIPSTADRPDEIDRCMEFVINHVENAGAVTVHRYAKEMSPPVFCCPVRLPRRRSCSWPTWTSCRYPTRRPIAPSFAMSESTVPEPET